MALHQHILEVLTAAGHEAYVVGGFVRDQILQRPSKDADVTTSARPAELLTLFPDAEIVGAHFGVVLVKRDGETVEVASFRRRGNPYIFEQHNADIWHDLLCRDFTINTMLMDRYGNVLDLLDSNGHFEHRRVVAVSAFTFTDDPLRMLRAVRFACQLGFAIDPTTFQRMRDAAHLVLQISPERVQQELSRILTSGAVDLGIDLMRWSGLLEHLLPEIAAMVGVQQNPTHHPEGDVYVHTLKLLKHLKPGCSLTLALSALLHDVGKPLTFENHGGKITFYEHERVGSSMVRPILGRFKFANDVIDTVERNVADHMRFRVTQEMRRGKLYRFLRQPNFPELLQLHKMDASAGSGNMANAQFVESVLASVPPEVIRPLRLVTGNDLIDLGITPGKRLGQILEAIEELQLEGEITTREEALSFAKTAGEVGYITKEAVNHG